MFYLSAAIMPPQTGALPRERMIVNPKIFAKALGKKFAEHVHEIAIAFLVDIEKINVAHVLLVAGAVLISLGILIIISKDGGQEAAAAAGFALGAQ